MRAACGNLPAWSAAAILEHEVSRRSSRWDDVQVSIQAAGDIARAGFVTNSQDKTFQRRFGSQGADDDIVVSSTRAYISALSKMGAYLSEHSSAEAVGGNGSVSAAAAAAAEKAQRAADKAQAAQIV